MCQGLSHRSHEAERKSHIATGQFPSVRICQGEKERSYPSLNCHCVLCLNAYSEILQEGQTYRVHTWLMTAGCHLRKPGATYVPDPVCSMLVNTEWEVHRQRMHSLDSQKLLSKAIPSTDPQTEIYAVCSTQWNWGTPGNKPSEVILLSPHSKGKVCFHSQALPISKPGFSAHILKIATKVPAMALPKRAKWLSRNEAC